MEVVMVEARTYEAMMSRFEEFVEKVDALCRRHGNERKKWLDSQDVCIILNISKRTLQSLRDSGKLAFTMVGNKSYYRPEDVERIIGEIVIRKEKHHE
jgi:3-methyladenine DNA glycosylase Tag